MTTFTATYSCDDNKLRLSASSRLSPELYARVKAAGFAWAPKQEIFVAPMWTPDRADLCLELAGEIGDEDTSLCERAEDRAERFDEYREKRAADAQRASDYVHSIADNIPLGQPILCGHHSERHARKDAERIENGMRRAVRMWDTSEYWKRRAAGAIAAAKYKERPDVRARRIKGLEADARKQAKHIAECERLIRTWDKVPRMEWDKQTRFAELLSGRLPSVHVRTARAPHGSSIYSEVSDGRMHGDTAWRLALSDAQTRAAYHRRWLDHYENRLIYERAMLAEGGGIAADRFAIEVGGTCLVRGSWHGVLRVNRKDGAIVSLSLSGRTWGATGIEEVQDYRAPTPEKAEAVKEAQKLPPMCNYPGEGFVHMTKAEWNDTHADYKGSRELGAGCALNKWAKELTAEQIASAAAGIARHRVRSVVKGARGLVFVYLTDEKIKEAPRVDAPAKKARSWKPKDAPGATDPLDRFEVNETEGEQTVSQDSLETAADPLPAIPDAATVNSFGAENTPEHVSEKAAAELYAAASARVAAGDVPVSQEPAEPVTARDAIAVAQVREFMENGSSPAYEAMGETLAAIDAGPTCETVFAGCVERRRGWADDGREPWSHDVKREADGLLAIADQPDFTGQWETAYREAAAKLHAWADALRQHEQAHGGPAALPDPVPAISAPPVPVIPAPAPKAADLFPRERAEVKLRPGPEIDPTRLHFEAMRESLRNGVQVVSAPQLFPTPPSLAARMVAEAQLCDGDRILEPSAGTGRILDAILAESDGMPGGVSVVAVELMRSLADDLQRRYGLNAPQQTPGQHVEVICRDFVSGPHALPIGLFDRVIMNPPFADFADLLHVSTALDYLKPGGRLVAIMSAGVMFRSDRKTVAFRSLISSLGGRFEELPADTFSTSGTGVNTVLLVVDVSEAARRALPSFALAGAPV